MVVKINHSQLSLLSNTMCKFNPLNRVAFFGENNAVSTDSQMITIIPVDVSDCKENEQISIDAESVKMILKKEKKFSQLTITYEEKINKVRIEVEGSSFVYYSSSFDISFPPYKEILPNDGNEYNKLTQLSIDPMDIVKQEKQFHDGQRKFLKVVKELKTNSRYKVKDSSDLDQLLEDTPGLEVDYPDAKKYFNSIGVNWYSFAIINDNLVPILCDKDTDVFLNVDISEYLGVKGKNSTKIKSIVSFIKTVSPATLFYYGDSSYNQRKGFIQGENGEKFIFCNWKFI